MATLTRWPRQPSPLRLTERYTVKIDLPVGKVVFDNKAGRYIWVPSPKPRQLTLFDG